MAHIRTDFSPPYSILEDLTRKQTTENIIHKEPPRYGFLNPMALKNQNIGSPITVQYQPQSKIMSNVRSTLTISDDPLRINSQINEIKSYKIWSILNTLCCCLILGIVAWHYSGETNELKLKNDIKGALNASKTARTMNIIATLTGIIIVTLYMILHVTVFQQILL